jgi:hypothetical protein
VTRVACSFRCRFSLSDRLKGVLRTLTNNKSDPEIRVKHGITTQLVDDLGRNYVSEIYKKILNKIDFGFKATF